jgi:head-tail adaptor
MRRAGQRDQRVVIQTVNESTDTHGAPVLTPATLTTVWATVSVAAPGSESKQGGQITGSTTYLVETDYNATTSAITTKHRATWRGKTFEIGGVDPSRLREGVLLLSCAEVAS